MNNLNKINKEKEIDGWISVLIDTDSSNVLNLR